MTKLVWSGDARRDLYRIIEFYQTVDLEVTVRFAEAIRSEPLRLLEYPQMGSLTARRGTRKWPVRGTPFRLYYALIDGTVVIQRVVHAAMGEA